MSQVQAAPCFMILRTVPGGECVKRAPFSSRLRWALLRRIEATSFLHQPLARYRSARDVRRLAQELEDVLRQVVEHRRVLHEDLCRLREARSKRRRSRFAKAQLRKQSKVASHARAARPEVISLSALIRGRPLNRETQARLRNGLGFPHRSSPVIELA